MSFSYFNAWKRSVRFRFRDKMGLPIKPFKLRLAVTNRCNARCRMCNAWKAENSRAEELSQPDYERLFEKSAAFFSQLRHVSLTGGEPTLRKDLVELIAAIHRRHPRVAFNINTNGFLPAVVEKTAREARDRGAVVSFNFSVDGIGELHDAMRGVSGAWEKVAESVARLEQLRGEGIKVKIGINHVITPENWQECEKVHAWCRQRKLNFNPILPVTGELYSNEEMGFAFPENLRLQLVHLFEQFRKEEPHKAMAYGEIIRQLHGDRRDFPCWAGKVMLLIEENGAVYPNGGCPSDWALGRLQDFDFDLSRLMASKQARDVGKNVAHCRQCELACETLTTLRYPEALAGWRKEKAARENSK